MTSRTPATDAVTIPEPLAPEHELDTFKSGVATLDEWLKHRARRNEAQGASRTIMQRDYRRILGEIKGLMTRPMAAVYGASA